MFLAKNETFSLRVYAVEKESPYSADGIAMETSPRTEIYLTAPSGDRECSISFLINGTTYEGDMSFDNVKSEYYFSRVLDISALQEIPFTIQYGDTTLQLNALSVLDKDTLSAEEILQRVQVSESELFTSLTEKHGFCGEIYLRLLYEDAPYYYVGIIDRNENVTAFLLNAKTGKILAKRTP